MYKRLQVVVLSALLCCWVTTRVLAQQKPNILVILADDLGYNDLGFTGSKDIKTPELDRLANNGVTCTNGYVTHAYCGPSRAGLLTGRYQARFGMEINPSYSPFDLYMGLPLTETMFAARLQTAGYRTGIIGKWHMGAAPPYHPNNRGFDHFYGFLSGGHTYFPSGINTTLSLHTKAGTPHYSANEGGYRPLVLNNGAGKFTEYLTTALSRNAAEFVSKSSDKPFMLYLAYNAPHEPLEAPKETIDKYKHIKDKRRRTYAAMIDKMDQGIGMVVEALRKSGKLDNTIIFFLSDNGGVAKKGRKNQPAYASNFPFREGKGSMYEGGSHVPFIVHWPKMVKKPIQFTGLVSSLDIAATALAVAEADTTNARLDGINLVPYLNNDKKGSPHNALFWRQGEDKGWAVRTVTSKYLFQGYRDKNLALFDMVNDPYETTNVVQSNKKKRKQLAALWNKWNAMNTPIVWDSPNKYQKLRIAMYKAHHEELQKKAKKRTPLVIE